MLAAFPFLQPRTLPAVRMLRKNPAPAVPPWLSPQTVPIPSTLQQGWSDGVNGPPQSTQIRVSSQLGVYALQALTEQDLEEGHDPPYARLSRELENRARDVRSLAALSKTFFRGHTTPDSISGLRSKPPALTMQEVQFRSDRTSTAGSP